MEILLCVCAIIVKMARLILGLLCCVIAFQKVLSDETECGGVLNGPSGRFSSPIDTTTWKYESESYCVWTIVVNEAKRVLLTVEDIDIEIGRNCKYDSLQVFDGEDIEDEEKSLGKFCGEDPPAPIASTGSAMTVIFYSDDYVEQTGFNATYEETDGSVCEIRILEEAGSIEWLGNPEIDTLDCSWIIGTNVGKSVQILFTYLSLPTSTPCEKNYLKIYAMDEEIDTFCGGMELPDLYTLTTISVRVELHIENNQRGIGFLLVYLKIDDDHLCGELLIRPEGTIQSVDRNEDGLYDPNSKCYWILVAPVSTTIRIEFLSITLEESNDCIYDFIAVYEGMERYKNDDHTLLYCGEVTPPPFKSMTNILVVYFHSDDSRHYEGFTITYTHVGDEIPTSTIRPQSTDGVTTMKTSTEDVSTRHTTLTTRITTGDYFSTEDIGTTSVTQGYTSEPGVTVSTNTMDTGITYSSVNENLRFSSKPSTSVSSSSRAPTHEDTAFTTDKNIQSTESIADTKSVSVISLILLSVVATLLTVL